MTKTARTPPAIAADTESSPANPIKVNAYPNAGADYEEIRRLAREYEYWFARGCPEGSPEEDWFRAEQDVLGTAADGARPATPDGN